MSKNIDVHYSVGKLSTELEKVGPSKKGHFLGRVIHLIVNPLKYFLGRVHNLVTSILHPTLKFDPSDEALESMRNMFEQAETEFEALRKPAARAAKAKQEIRPGLVQEKVRQFETSIKRRQATEPTAVKKVWNAVSSALGDLDDVDAHGNWPQI